MKSKHFQIIRTSYAPAQKQFMVLCGCNCCKETFNVIFDEIESCEQDEIDEIDVKIELEEKHGFAEVYDEFLCDNCAFDLALAASE